MEYTLITKTGKIYQFYSKGLAKTFQGAYGGTIITAKILVDTATV